MAKGKKGVKTRVGWQRVVCVWAKIQRCFRERITVYGIRGSSPCILPSHTGFKNIFIENCISYLYQLLKRQQIHLGCMSVCMAKLIFSVQVTVKTLCFWVKRMLTRILQMFPDWVMMLVYLMAGFLVIIHILRKGPSINYVVSKSAIFDPLPPLSHLFTK